MIGVIKRLRKPIYFAALCVAVGSYFIRLIGVPLPLEWSNAIAFSVIAFLLWELASVLVKKNSAMTFQADAAARQAVVDLVHRRPARKAVLIQYSGVFARDYLDELLHVGATVEMWVRSPASEPCREQRERIENSLRSLRGELLGRCRGRLEVLTYTTPGSIRGLLVDDDVLVIGWYTYEVPEQPNALFADDPWEVSGHDRPSIVCQRGDAGFEELCAMFLDQIKNFKMHCSAPIVEVQSP
jgi:hypothetical protein